jgi:ketol-acid reductoisomerase
MKSPYYKTNELAKLVGISKNTLLRWEAEGIIPASLRDGRGWRVWSKETLEQIIEIKKSKESTTIRTASKKTIVNIIGYGNQAEAWAKNLKNSGASVKILLRAGSNSIRRASNDGFDINSIEKGLRETGIFCLLIPDQEHGLFFNEYESIITEEHIFVFGHGFSIGYQQIKTKAQKILLAPKAIASLVRSRYLDAKTVPAVYSAEFSKEKQVAEELADLLGFDPLIEASFYTETVSDLFSEQAVLCSIVPFIVMKATEFLKSKGIPEEIAVFECLHELSFILDVMKQKGFAGMYKSISPVAAAGGLKIIKEFSSKFNTDEYLNSIFKGIESKDFLKYLDGVNREELMEYSKKISDGFDKSIEKVKEN